MYSVSVRIFDLDVEEKDLFEKESCEFHWRSPGLEPETLSVLDWRDNQLHEGTNYYFITGYILLQQGHMGCVRRGNLRMDKEMKFLNLGFMIHTELS